MKTKNLKLTAIALLSASFLSEIYAEERLVVESVGFATPESVEYYESEDVYLVTNINGSPVDVDGNGFISKLSPDGKVIDLKWIDGSNPGTKLNAPKGATISGNILYVADLDEVHLFDLPSGDQIASVQIEGSSFLNGITPGKNNSVYVTDSGLNGADSGLIPSGTDAIHQVSASGKYRTIVKDGNMGHPNGIISHENTLVVATFGSGEVYYYDEMGTRNLLPVPPGGSLDGLLRMDDGSYLISSWESSAVYRLGPDGVYSIVATSLDAPADMGYDTKRKRVLVPLFNEDKVVILSIKQS